ncbi:MAG: hypothetical protein K6F00_06025 [Lachnospiraceae bacterium]|nr:hypothetical protein [Lachnospiraceae bacterium]
MKQIMFSLAAAAVLILSVVAIFSIEGRSAREKDLNIALRESAREALSECVSLRYNDRMLSLVFRTLLLDKLSDTSDEERKLKIDILEADSEKGLLSVSATEEFTYPNKKKGEVKCNATVILEEERKKENCLIRYFIPWQEAKELGMEYVTGEDALYAFYLVEKGMKMPAPNNFREIPAEKTVEEDMDIHGHIY